MFFPGSWYRFLALFPYGSGSVESWAFIEPVEQLIPWINYPLVHGDFCASRQSLGIVWCFDSAIEGEGRSGVWLILWVLTSSAAGATYVFLEPNQLSPLIGVDEQCGGYDGIRLCPAQRHTCENMGGVASLHPFR